MAKILIVDDEQAIVDSIVDVLNTFGFETISATDGREGFKMATEQEPDLIILDWMMKDYNGLQFTEDFRNANYNTPIIFLTARGNATDYQVEALRIGADDYLAKPFEPGVLVARIKAALRRASYPSKGGSSKSTGDENRHVYSGGRLIVTMSHVNLRTENFSFLSILRAMREESVREANFLTRFGSMTISVMREQSMLLSEEQERRSNLISLSSSTFLQEEDRVILSLRM